MSNLISDFDSEIEDLKCVIRAFVVLTNNIALKRFGTESLKETENEMFEALSQNLMIYGCETIDEYIDRNYGGTDYISKAKNERLDKIVEQFKDILEMP
ncbi:hypothetical protein C4H01_RS24435 [Vibrio parahaemolyticus]|nr:hypothetical protein [Vibrio parahaemolyticus]EJG1052993.1 hypothetical protein [Vibrio parahaemolyticus]EKO3954007.1 hypothetical protein [Vibrio fluvialis]HBC3993246.1 hypothetical protein [Vibrio parahaemolyticus]